jgi:hypothetical protein
MTAPQIEQPLVSDLDFEKRRKIPWSTLPVRP